MAGKLFSATLAARERLAAALAPFNMTPTRYLVLSLLADVGPACLPLVAARLPRFAEEMPCVSNIVACLDDLIASGFVRRKEYRRANREPLYYLTTAGRERLLEASRAVAVADFDLSAHLPPGDRLQLRLLLERLANGASSVSGVESDRMPPTTLTPRDDATRHGLLSGLTDREAEVLLLIGQGRTNTEIADALTVTRSTMKTHVSHILGKFGMRSRTEAAAFAVTTGLLD